MRIRSSQPQPPSRLWLLLLSTLLVGAAGFILLRLQVMRGDGGIRFLENGRLDQQTPQPILVADIPVATTTPRASAAPPPTRAIPPDVDPLAPWAGPVPRPTTTQRLLTEVDVIQAFDCARQQHELPAYVRDPQLDREAQTIMERVLQDTTKPLADQENGYALTGQLMLDRAYPALAPCMVGGFDIAKIQDLDRASRIGVAVAPVPIDVYGQSVQLTIVIGR